MKKIAIEKLNGTPFQKKVWQALTHIKRGKTLTYKELAERIGHPHAVRAVANAVGANPIPARIAYGKAVAGGAPTIPCHRVVRSDGALGGYSGKGGVKTKKLLLQKEGVLL